MKSLNRRKFLKLAATGTCGAAVHQVLSPVGGCLAFAAPPTAAALGPAPILVVVNMAGGCSYNITPIYEQTYYDKNPTLSYQPGNSLPIAPDQGLHPALVYLKQIWDEGNLALLNLVGYPNPNRSHAESTDIWMAGMRNASPAVNGGWGARLTCQLASTFGGISLTGQNLFSQGDCYPPRALGDLNNFGENSIYWGRGDASEWLRRTRDDMVAKSTFAQTKNAAFVRDGMIGLQESINRIRAELDPATRPLPPGITFGNSGFGNQCRDAARIIMAGGLGTRLIFLEIGGFDTHANERTSLNNLLTSVNAGLRGLIEVAKAVGQWGNLVMVTMSEFGRTFENDSGGNDHGHGASMLISGGGVVGGIKSPAPTAADTAASDFYRGHHIHFVEPFYQVVQAMGLNADLVFPEPITRRYFSLFS